MKNFSVMGGSLKNLIFKRGFPINQHIGVKCLKRGAWTVSDSELREGGEGRFEGGLATLMQIMYFLSTTTPIRIVIIF